MEKWDLYNAKREKSGITMCRGEIIPKGLYHLFVCDFLAASVGSCCDCGFTAATADDLNAAMVNCDSTTSRSRLFRLVESE